MFTFEQFVDFLYYFQLRYAVVLALAFFIRNMLGLFHPWATVIAKWIDYGVVLWVAVWVLIGISYGLEHLLPVIGFSGW